MSWVGACADNAAMKSFSRLLQKNVLNRRRWSTRQDLRAAIVFWIAASASDNAAALPAVLAERSRDAFERLLTHDVRWGGESDTEQTCHNRQQAADTYAALLAGGAC